MPHAMENSTMRCLLFFRQYIFGAFDILSDFRTMRGFDESGLVGQRGIFYLDASTRPQGGKMTRKQQASYYFCGVKVWPIRNVLGKIKNGELTEGMEFQESQGIGEFQGPSTVTHGR